MRDHVPSPVLDRVDNDVNPMAYNIHVNHGRGSFHGHTNATEYFSVLAKSELRK